MKLKILPQPDGYTMDKAVVLHDTDADRYIIMSAENAMATAETIVAAVTDAEILKEIERRIAEHFETPGWAEENAGFDIVQRWIVELRTPLVKPDLETHTDDIEGALLSAGGRR